jgi:ABC-2 type transport system ATP-binding protein
VGKQLLQREPFGGLVSATVMGNGNASERQQAVALGLELAPVSLQQLIVHLTRDPSARKAVAI